jgi:hypothetical protein
MGGFPAAGARVSLRNVRAAAGVAVSETTAQRKMILEGLVPMMKAYEARVVALEAVLARGFLGRLRWLVTGQ